MFDGGNVHEEYEPTTRDLFLNKVYIHLNMLSALMLDGIAGEIDGTNVIAVHQSSLRKGEVKLQKEVAKPT